MKLPRSLRKHLRRIWGSLWCTNEKGITKVGGATSWAINTEILPHNATIVSGGVGNDVTFERELADHYGCTVYIFDPSPTGMETMARPENQHERIFYFPLGLAAIPGTLVFTLPDDPEEGSYTVARDNATVRSTRFSCTTVSAFFNERQLGRIDVLKLDIEGFEYGVIDDVLSERLPISQLCIEYHHFMKGISVWQTCRSIWRLKRSGFSICRKEMCDYLFVARLVRK